MSYSAEAEIAQIQEEAEPGTKLDLKHVLLLLVPLPVHFCCTHIPSNCHLLTVVFMVKLKYIVLRDPVPTLTVYTV